VKIGILTYYSNPNFGANLQALSTVGFLKKKNIEPVMINWLPEDLELMYRRRVPGNQYAAHLSFVDKYLPQTPLCRSEDDVVQMIDKLYLDGIIIGSDGVLYHTPFSRRKFFSRRKLKFVDVETTEDSLFPNPYWGCFIPKLKRKIPVVGYAISCQHMPYFALDEKDVQNIANALKYFTFISVRDSWTVNMLQFVLGDKYQVPIVPDPVFAFNENNFLPVVEKKELLLKYNLPEKYVLISFGHITHIPGVSSFWIKKLERLFEKEGITCVALPVPEGVFPRGLEHSINLPLSPLEWYYLIKYSSGYIGERMHPIIVALHNEIPFFCFDENGTYKDTKNIFFRKHIASSSKTYDLLKQVDLLGNYYSYPMNITMISPAVVFHNVIHFDIDKCKRFNSISLSRYNAAMKRTMAFFGQEENP
jgi:polysaccharide pyruvyl transferase WcaK-like protein